MIENNWKQLAKLRKEMIKQDDVFFYLAIKKIQDIRPEWEKIILDLVIWIKRTRHLKNERTA